MDPLEERLQKFSYSTPSFQTDERIKNTLRQALQCQPISFIDVLLKQVGMATAFVLLICLLANIFLIHVQQEKTRSLFPTAAGDRPPAVLADRYEAEQKEWLLHELETGLAAKYPTGKQTISPWYFLWLKDQWEKDKAKTQDTPRPSEWLWFREEKLMNKEGGDV